MATRLPFKWHSNVVDSLVDFESVQPHEQNPNNGDTDAVRESILANGVYRHIYASKRTKRIVAGHTQYHVEVELQLEAGVDRPVVPISWVDGGAKEAAKMLVVDNEAAKRARMDDALLYDLLTDLDGDLYGTLYDGDDLAALAAKLDTPFEPMPDDDTKLDELDAKPCPKCGYDLANDPEALRKR
jgi:hypothetical protein